jgi:hypothetical protein
MNKAKMLILLNTSGQDELTKLAGIGPALAQRIIAARPFKSLEAVTTVKGVSAGLLENWMATPAVQPALQPVLGDKQGSSILKADQTGESAAKPPQDNGKDVIVEKGQILGEKLSEFSEAVKKRGKAVYDAAKGLPEDFERESKARGPLWTLLVSNGVTALVSILLTLLILGVINGSLKYATGSQYRSIKNDVSALSTQASLIQQDQESLRGRVDTLEGLGERIVTLESAQQQLATDLVSTNQQMDTLQTQVTALIDKVDQQEARTLRFEEFLKELQNLLGNLFAEGDTQ